MDDEMANFKPLGKKRGWSGESRDVEKEEIEEIEREKESSRGSD